MDADGVIRRSVGTRAVLQNRPAQVIQLDPLVEPEAVDNLYGWLKLAAPFIKQLGGHPDDAFTSQILQALEYAKLISRGTQAVSVETRRWRRENWKNIWKGLRPLLVANSLGVRSIQCFLFNEGYDEHGRVNLEKSLASLRLVTDAGVAAMVDAFTNTFELETFNFHGVGTGSTAEAVTQTALTTELTTQLSPDNTRATGAQTQPSANIYQSLATTTYDASQGVQEHGLFSQSATGGGTLWDRSQFSIINSTSIQHTHQTTVPAGG